MHVQRHFMGWERPVLDAAVARLTADWNGGLLDLSDWLLIVPTHQADRRLRRHLAAWAAARGTAALPPRIATPSRLIDAARRGRRVASRAAVLALWTDTLCHCDLTELTDLFPVAPPRQDFGWALGVAEKISLLRGQLGENGYGFADVLDRVGEPFGDAPRWRNLKTLEDAYLARLAAAGLEDPEFAAREAAAAYELPEGISRVVLVAVPDPVPIALTALGRAAATGTVEVWIHAPASCAAVFDDWGRPRVDAWVERVVDLPEEAITLVGKPQAQAEVAGRLFTAGKPLADVAIGVADPDVTPCLERVLREQGIAAFDPAGQIVGRHPLYALLRVFIELAGAQSYESLSAALRHPDLLRFLLGDDDEACVVKLLTAVDRLQNAHLPATLEAFASRAEKGGSQSAVMKRALARLDRLVSGFREADFPDNVLGLLQTVYSGRRLHLSDEFERTFADIAAVIVEMANDPGIPLLGKGSASHVSERLAILLRLLKTQPCYPDRDDSAVDLEGWLELHWNDAPYLVVTGFNEGRVPDAIVGDPFLPDRARRELELAHNDRRLARDVYLFSAMLASRTAPGAVQIVLGKVSAEGDALKPSRLLLLCPQDSLPGRALKLFGEVPEGAPPPARTSAWKLRPTVGRTPVRLPVTVFRDYLACPFRFYLKRVLGMETLDDRKVELDVLDFGTVCHRALEALGKDTAMQHCEAERDIAEFLQNQAEAWLKRQFGPALSTPLLIQLAAARQRLAAAARVQARLVREGYRIVATEFELGGEAGVRFHDFWVRGTVDRIDACPDGGYLLLDYKTSDRAAEPVAAHLRGARKNHGTPEFAVFNHNGKAWQWVDLQLPLYCLFRRQELHGPLQCGYFNIPKAVTETAVAVWDIEDDLLDAAAACAKGVIDAVREGRFWPPAERVQYDDFERLFHDPPQISVDPGALNPDAGPPVGSAPSERDALTT